jgi:hypothetical protein
MNEPSVACAVCGHVVSRDLVEFKVGQPSRPVRMWMLYAAMYCVVVPFPGARAVAEFCGAECRSKWT